MHRMKGRYRDLFKLSRTIEENHLLDADFDDDAAVLATEAADVDALIAQAGLLLKRPRRGPRENAGPRPARPPAAGKGKLTPR